MNVKRRVRRPKKLGGQRGYVLLFLLLMMAMLVIALSAAVPRLTTDIKREREIEMIHRGEQYARAIRRYYKKFGRYPSRIEELEKTNNIRFLRKRYKDPMSPDGTWRLLHVGDVKIGQSGLGNLTPVAQQPQSLEGGQSGSSLFGNSPQAQAQRGGEGGEGTPASFGSGGTTAAASSSAGSPTFGGQVFGGGPIIGVASLVNKKGIHEFNNKANYRDWMFIYDPSMDRGGLIKGPYNPNAFMGQAGGAVGTSPQGTGGTMPTIPGVSGQGGIFGGGSGNSSTSPR